LRLFEGREPLNVWKAAKSRLRSLFARGEVARLDHRQREIVAARIGKALRAEGHAGIGDPLRVFPLPLSQLNSFLDLRDFGAKLPLFGICDGDWDLKGRPIERLPVYRMCEEHFAADVPWQETKVFRDLQERRGSKTGGNRNLDPQYLQYMDTLFDAIKAHGYKPQLELRRERDFHGTRPGPLNEVQIFVGRDGRCMVKMGLHRTILAKLLKLDTIPVRTRVRHPDWQAIRDELCRSGGACQLSEEAKRHLNHPELQDIRGL
jgi:hypothetical protein